MKRLLWLGSLLFLFAVWTGCGDTFRPIIIPNPPAFPDPRANHGVISINDNGSVPGSVMTIDVSGDSITSEANLGLHPVHAVQQTATQVLAVNHSIAGQNADSLTKISFVNGTSQISSTTTIGLPPDSAPTFVATTEASEAYVSLPDYVPDPVNHPGIAAVGVVNTSTTNALDATILAGTHPDSLAETPDGKKLYIANKGGTDAPSVIGINTLDLSPRNSAGPIVLGAVPLWVTARSDSQRVYVLEADGTLATLDTTATGGPDSVIATQVVAPGATLMLYDGNLERLYIPYGNQVAILSVAGDTPQPLNTITLPPIPGVPSVPSVAVAVTALPDGSRAYLASSSAAPLNSLVDISAVAGDGTTATYTYSPDPVNGGHDLTPGIVITVAGTAAGFDGTYLITAVSNGTFQAANATKSGAAAVTGTGISSNNYFPQVTVITTSANGVKVPAVQVPGFAAYDAACASTRFRYTMASAGDSSRVYLASCDGGNVSIIQTSDDTYTLNLQALASERAIVPPFTQPPPQNPVFLIGGP